MTTVFPSQILGPEGKENAPTMQQGSIMAAFDKTKAVSASGSMKGRKRTITLVTGEDVDLRGGFNITSASPLIIEAMRQRIFQLEDELEAAQQQPASKRAKTTTSAASAAAATSASAGPSAASVKADEKKRKMHLKKIYDQLKKECKSDSCKFQGGSKSIKIDEVLEQAEFESMFGGKGTLIQPTPTNKPKSTVTIIQFNGAAHIQDLFGDELKALKGNRWSRGGVPTRTFGGGFGGFGSTFSKSVKQGACDVAIQSLEVNYSKNSLKCSLKFEVGEIGGGYGGYDSDY